MNHINKIRQAVADYMGSEGCTCCQNIESHKLHRDVLGKLLHVAKYEDGSGYDFNRYRTKPDNGSGGQS